MRSAAIHTRPPGMAVPMPFAWLYSFRGVVSPNGAAVLAVCLTLEEIARAGMLPTSCGGDGPVLWLHAEETHGGLTTGDQDHSVRLDGRVVGHGNWQPPDAEGDVQVSWGAGLEGAAQTLEMLAASRLWHVGETGQPSSSCFVQLWEAARIGVPCLNLIHASWRLEAVH